MSRARDPLPRTPLVTTVDGFTHGGEGVARVEGKAVFIPGALPGERVRIAVTTDRRRWARADLLEVIEPAADRVDPPCPHIPACGGCDLQHVSAQGQLALKTRVVREQLQRIGRMDDPPVADCLPVGPALGTRLQARFHVDHDGRLGFHRRGSNDVHPVATCIVLDEHAQAMRDLVGDATVAPGDQVAVHATSTGAAAIVRVAAPDTRSRPRADRTDDATIDDVDDGPVTATGRHLLHGPAVLTEHVAGFDLDVTASGFFQGSAGGAAALVEAVRTAVARATTTLDTTTAPVVWDLYAGVGLFSLPLAADGNLVTAVEVVGDATTHLRANATRAGLAGRVEVVTADVARFVTRADHPRPDVVVLDPPRAGAGERVAAAIAAAARTTIVYVACDPAALARDTRVLVDAGWRLAWVQPLDLFPMTHHVEAVALLER